MAKGGNPQVGNPRMCFSKLGDFQVKLVVGNRFIMLMTNKCARVDQLPLFPYNRG